MPPRLTNYLVVPRSYWFEFSEDDSDEDDLPWLI